MSEDTYFLQRDRTESERLNKQHELLKDAVGFLVHPGVQSQLSQYAKIADVATGTGVIALELASVLPPTCQIDGFDISSAQFPSNTPPNVRFHVANAKEPPSADFFGKYDLVYCRFIGAGIHPDEVACVGRHLRDLLKPGGYLHWLEGDWPRANYLIRADPLSPTPASQRASELIAPFVAQYSYIHYGLKPTLLDVGGWEIVEDYVTSTDRRPENRPAVTSVVLPVVLYGVLPRSQQGRTDKLSQVELDKLVKEVVNEFGQGKVYVRFDLHMLIAKKTANA